MKTRIGYLLTAYASLFCYGLIDNMRGPAYPYMLDQFDLTNSQGSQIFAISSISALITISLGRLWIKHLGELNAQRIWLILILIATALMGLSAYAGGFALLIGSSFLLGLGLGGTTLATNLLVAYGSTEHNRRRFYGGLHSMYGISSVIAPAAFALTVKAGLLWGASFAIMSLVVLLPLATGFLTEQVEHEYDTSQKPDRMNVWFRLRVGLAMSFYVASEVAISSRLVLYATNKLSLDPADAAYYLSLFFALLLTGRLSLFLFPLRISTYRLMSLSAATSLALLLLGIFVHPLFMSLCGLTMSIYFPCGMEWISKRFGKNAGYMMTSVMLSITVALIFMHQLMGIATDIFGITNAMLLSVLFLVLAIAALFSNRGSSLDKCIFLEGSSLDKRQV